MSVTVHIENTYSDGHASSATVKVPDPESHDDIESWWDDVVWNQTGDGHGVAHPKLGTCHTAEVIATDSTEDRSLVGQYREWVSS